MKHRLDIDTWARKPHFEFFKTFEEPYHGVCVSVSCGPAYRFAKTNGHSVFLSFLHKSLAAAHRVEAFRYRLEEEQVFLYDQIDAASTVARRNGTFGYGHIPYSPDLETFLQGAEREVERVKRTSDLKPNQATNVIRYSALPWIDFTSLSHARLFSRGDSCPLISFGKMTESGGDRRMPMSIHAHHALVDGLHVGQYIDSFQELLNQP